MGDNGLAWLVPVLARPHRVQPLLDAIEATTPDAEVVFIADPDDTPEHDAIQEAETSVNVRTLHRPGSWAFKINEAVRETDARWLVLGADDVVPHPGWFDAALATGAQVVGLNDDRPRGWEHATHFLVRRDYALLPAIDGSRGPVFEGYAHNFPDRELVETAKRRRVYAYARDAVVEHEHHLDGKAEMDSTYAKGQESFRLDAKLFRRRSRYWAK